MRLFSLQVNLESKFFVFISPYLQLHRKANESKPKENDSQPNHDSENTGDVEQVVEASTAEDDEILRPVEHKAASESGDEEEGEVNDKFIRPLTEVEQVSLGKSLGDDWKKLAIKLKFKADEVSNLQLFYEI